MQTGHELFIHGLTDILDGEQQLVDALETLADDSANPQLKRLLRCIAGRRKIRLND